ncbi:hypothetical protein SLEP1_g35724 [Rubroshorea leprosula]|uniref:Uncharacterized protein n=1 Tax=Rubroshorea leprosula TaxID=152421 RepID=A0AAV5KPM9_9ROSI|nr:hypothetical protein SLEP1_g35724 [Rubroshorea leprosula]
MLAPPSVGDFFHKNLHALDSVPSALPVNSCLKWLDSKKFQFEVVAVGLPMVTWPLESVQFCNEKLANEVVKIGVGVGVKEWVRVVGDFVKREAIENDVKEIMFGPSGREQRR